LNLGTDMTNRSKHFVIHSKCYLAAYIYGWAAKYIEGQVAKRDING
jgi:hypothetical protein